MDGQEILLFDYLFLLNILRNTYKVILALPPFSLKRLNKLRASTKFQFQYITACYGREEIEINPDKGVF